MAREITLSRVDDDLAAGHVLVALTRLRGLVRTYPHDLELRHRLAEVYRGLGEPAEAGRWAYLSPDLTPDERDAFARQFPDPMRRMRALGWYLAEEQAPTRLARDRLHELRDEARTKVDDRLAYVALGRRRHVRRGGFPHSLGSLGLFGLAMVLALAGLGGAVFAIAMVAKSMF